MKKLNKQETKERMVFVLNSMVDVEEGIFDDQTLINGFPTMLHIPKNAPLFLFSSQTNGEKATYCGILYGLVQLELTKEQLNDIDFIKNQISEQAKHNQGVN